MRVATSCSFCAMTSSVLSPEMVPTISGHLRESTASPAALPLPESVRIRRAPYDARLIRLDRRDFFAKVHAKLVER